MSRTDQQHAVEKLQLQRDPQQKSRARNYMCTGMYPTNCRDCL